MDSSPIVSTTLTCGNAPRKSRDPVKARGLGAALGGGVTVGTFGTAPASDIVILAVPYTSAVPVVASYGDALAGKVIIDISNTFNADATGLGRPVPLPWGWRCR